MNWLEITMLALVDAVNPCTLAVQALLLSALVMTKGRKDALKGGILFTLTIYIMYFLYGLGILQIIYVLGLGDILRFILAGLLIIMAVAELWAAVRYRPGFVSMEMPMRFRPIAQKCLKSVENPWMAVPVAMLCSVLLLPCSSGPYVSALILMSMSVVKLVALLYYNLIFVLPMIAITLIVYFGTSPEKVMEWREKHIRKLHLIAGILLLGVLILTVPTNPFVPPSPTPPTSTPATHISNKTADNYVYLIYSETCPHCHNLLRYLDAQNLTDIKVMATTNPSKYAKVLEKKGFKWDGGVPLLFAVLKNGSLIVVEGFPSESQWNDGYFLGKEKEMEMCEELHGVKIFENGEYKYCKVGDMLLGNKYSVDHLIHLCRTQGCERL